jgi:hypothetical protein
MINWEGICQIVRSICLTWWKTTLYCSWNWMVCWNKISKRLQCWGGKKSCLISKTFSPSGTADSHTGPMEDSTDNRLITLILLSSANLFITSFCFYFFLFTLSNRNIFSVLNFNFYDQIFFIIFNISKPNTVISLIWGTPSFEFKNLTFFIFKKPKLTLIFSNFRFYKYFYIKGPIRVGR